MSFEVINLLQKVYLNKKIESIYKNREQFIDLL